MTHDSLVIGIRDAQLSEHLQMEAELTLQKACSETSPTKSSSVTATMCIEVSCGKQTITGSHKTAK